MKPGEMKPRDRYGSIATGGLTALDTFSSRSFQTRRRVVHGPGPELHQAGAGHAGFVVATLVCVPGRRYADKFPLFESMI
jgi:hypothetical protein